ncbi:universal stress protein [Streptomyces polychromogenes]|nr:universal stress protein [Streptomyces polychromogenes]
MACLQPIAFTLLRRPWAAAGPRGADRGTVRPTAVDQDGLPGPRERLVHGHPVEVLVDAAQGADMLVVGSPGRGGFRRALLGPVSRQVALHAVR